MKTNIQKALSGLELAISLVQKHEKSKDEFTVSEYIGKTKTNRKTALENLNRLASRGILVKRKILIDGCLSNAYKKA